MAPVAGRVAHTKYNELVFAFGKRKRFFIPGLPVNRIAGMLKQIRACFGKQFVHIVLKKTIKLIKPLRDKAFLAKQKHIRVFAVKGLLKVDKG